MRRDQITFKKRSSFLSFEKDVEQIIRKLFVESRPYSDELIRYLTIPAKDCLDTTIEEYNAQVEKYRTPKALIEDGYIKLSPKIRLAEHDQPKSYLLISFDNFTPSGNSYYRDCTVIIDILCNTDYWDVGNYQLRPLKIAGYIDGLLNETRLSGIGTFQFLGMSELVLDENLSGYTLMYQAVHGNDDKLEPED